MVSVLNFGSLLVMLVAMTVALGVAFNLFSNLISENVGQQMAIILRSEWNKAILEKKIPKTFTTLTPEYSKMFNSLGGSFKLFHNSPDNNSDGEKQFVMLKKSNNPKEKRDIKKIPLPPKMNTIKDNIIGMFPNLTAVEYKIWKDNKLIFDSASANDMNIMKKAPPKDTWIMQLMNTTSIIEVKNDDGGSLARLEVRLNPNVISAGYICLLSLCIIIFLITLFFSRIATKMLSGVVVKPLNNLDCMMRQIASGNLEAAMSEQIVVKRPIKEVESLANSSNVIMSRMHDYINTLANQKLELEAQNLDLLENGRSLENVNLTLAHKNSKLKNILDNVEQGFFTFKKDLLIHSEYSLICEKIFDGYLSGRTLSSIIFKDNLNMQNFMNELLIKIFNASSNERKIYIPLLPEEISINDSVISIAYKVVKDEMNEESIMVIINDITEKRLLEKRMDEERKTLKMVVKSIINRLEFLDLVKDYEEFAQLNYKETMTEDNEHILRQIHTFKGNFSQYDMVNLVPKLNELEDKLYEMGSAFSIKDIDSNKLIEWLQEDLKIIVAYAGNDFMKDGEYCYIKKDKLIEIERMIQQTLSKQECKVILPLIKNLRYKSVKDLLKTYPDYVMRLSERLGKVIKPIEIIGDEILVDTNYYSKMTKSLSHIFRNCIDHGIETEDERLESGKEQMGNITCEVKELGSSFEITITDDGRGINTNALEEKVLSEELYTKEEWDNMTQKQKCDLIFEQGITTKEEATYISGRGVGMPAVKECVIEIGGTLTVDSTEGKGTMFRITLPKLEDGVDPYITSERFMEALVDTSKEIIVLSA